MQALTAEYARGLLEESATVLEAAHGGEAVAAAERHAGPLHLLVTDVVLAIDNVFGHAMAMASVEVARDWSEERLRAAYAGSIPVSLGVCRRP